MSSPGMPASSPSAESHPAVGCLIRIFWMAAGNIVLLLAAWLISQHRGGFWSGSDVLFWAVVLGLVLARFVDVRFLEGDTTTGERATMADFRRYALLVPLVAFVLWGVAHAAAWLF